jgi:hypothetical protein
MRMSAYAWELVVTNLITILKIAGPCTIYSERTALFDILSDSLDLFKGSMRAVFIQ